LHYFTFQCFAPLRIPCPTPTHIPCLLLSRALPSWEPNTHASLASQHTHPLPFCLLPHSHPLPTFSSHTLFLPLLSNTHIPSLLHLAVLCLVSHTHSLPSPLTRSSSVGATRTSLALHTSQRALSRACADVQMVCHSPSLSPRALSRACADVQILCHSPSLSPSPKHYSCLSIETLAFYTEEILFATILSRRYTSLCTRTSLMSSSSTSRSSSTIASMPHAGPAPGSVSSRAARAASSPTFSTGAIGAPRRSCVAQHLDGRLKLAEPLGVEPGEVDDAGVQSQSRGWAADSNPQSTPIPPACRGRPIPITRCARDLAANLSLQVDCVCLGSPPSPPPLPSPRPQHFHLSIPRSSQHTHPLHYFILSAFAPLSIPCFTPTHIPCLLHSSSVGA
jgi:hypothetical protein